MAEGICIGTSGWSYPGWRQGFYAGIPQKLWLTHYAEHFTGIEVNATFYRTVEAATLERWRVATPKGFPFVVKGHKVVSHVRKLNDVGSYVRKMRESMSPLADRLAAVLWQLPPNLPKDRLRLLDFCELVGEWRETRQVVEFRHESWFDEEIERVLADLDIANCISDSGKWPIWEAVTTDLVYVRLHGREPTYASKYGEEELLTWAEKVRKWRAEGRSVHVYFDNDAEGAAPYDALRLIEMTK